MCKTIMQEIQELNEEIKKTISHYYQNRDADSFFSIVNLMNYCRDNGWDNRQITQFIEMQNIIVMG